MKWKDRHTFPGSKPTEDPRIFVIKFKKTSHVPEYTMYFTSPDVDKKTGYHHEDFEEVKKQCDYYEKNNKWLI